MFYVDFCEVFSPNLAASRTIKRGEIKVAPESRRLRDFANKALFPKSVFRQKRLSYESVYIHKGQLATARLLSHRRFDTRFDKRRFLTSFDSSRRLKSASCQSVRQSRFLKEVKNRLLSKRVSKRL